MKPFQIPVIGLDISDESFKYVRLGQKRGYFEMDFFGEKKLPPDLLESGEIKNAGALAGEIKNTLLKYHPKNPYMILSLPEEKGFLRLIRTQRIPTKDVRKGLEFQLEEHIPYPPAELIFDYRVLNAAVAGDMMDVVITAYPKALIFAYMDVVRQAGFIPIAFELESQAVARAVVPRNTSGAFLVGDIGRTRTTFALVYQGEVHFTSTVKIGGRDIDNILMQSLHLTEEQANEVKKGRGFDVSSEDIIKSLSPALTALKDEADRHIGFWERRFLDKEETISKIFLCGGDALLKGLPEFFSRELNIPVDRSRIWENLFNLGHYIPPLDARETLRYATALGLAMQDDNILAHISS